MSGRAGDDGLAVDLARRAGEVLLDLRATSGLSGRELGDAGDAGSQQLIATALAEQRPDDAVLSEEALDDQARLEASRVWIIDPLDGTREYAEGRDDWAVHVCLAVDGVPGPSAVALPALDRVHASTDAPRAASGGPTRLRFAVSRSRPPAVATSVAAAMGAELLPMGSAGFKAMAVVDGTADAYVHGGGQFEWDSAAPVGVAVAAGLHCSRLDGSPLTYNRPEVSLPDLLICRPQIAGDLLTAIAEGLS